MSLLVPEFEFVDSTSESIRYLEHGWPTALNRWHAHEEFELHLITETRGTSFVGDYIGDFEAGALFLTGPHLPHNWISDDHWKDHPVPLRDMLVQFSRQSFVHLKSAFPEFREFDDLLARAQGGIAFLDVDIEVSRAHLVRIREASGAGRILRFLDFLHAVNAHPHQQVLSEHKAAFPAPKAKLSGIADVVDHITHNFAEEISLERAAEMAHSSPTAFSRNFQKFTGTKFTEFVTKVRIGQACAMLQATDEKIATICYEAGFRNLANFNRQFLKVKEMTPSAFRDLTRRELGPKPRVRT